MTVPFNLEITAKETLESAKRIYINTIAKLKEIGNIEDYGNLARIYKELANISDFPTNQDFLEQANKYEKLAAVFEHIENIPILDPKDSESDEDIGSDKENDLKLDEGIGSDEENDPNNNHFLPYAQYFAGNNRIPLGDINFELE
ncbi:MAG: hypothetical protein RCO49_06650 [Rickettsia endosymbiont of Argas persicus]